MIPRVLSMKYRILIGTLATFVQLLSISGDRAYAQSIRDQYNQEIRDAENEHAQKRDFLLTPLRDAEKCYQIRESYLDLDGGISHGNFMPYICRRKSNGNLMVLHGSDAPFFYYRSKRPNTLHSGSFYGDSGYAFSILSDTGTDYSYPGEWRFSATLRVINNNTFYIEWWTNFFTDYSGPKATPLFECHFDEMKCYAKRLARKGIYYGRDISGDTIIREISEVSLAYIIGRYE
jgi:hypothetical protein